MQFQASIAGLPGSSARVKVGPPLSATGPSFGSLFGWSPGWLNPQVPSESTFVPVDDSVAGPPQSPWSFPETIKPVAAYGAPPCPTDSIHIPPAPPVGAEFEAIVGRVRWSDLGPQ